MGMSTYVKGLRSDKDPEYQAMKQVLLACAKIKCDMPPEAAKYFGEEYPEEYLLEDALEIELGDAEEEFQDDSVSGVIIDLEKLPPGIKKLKFCNGY